MADRPPLEKIEGALPSRFDFYHLGTVELVPASEPGAEIGDDREAVAFSLAGDVRGMLVVVFEQGLDASMYAELGNVIASRAATELSRSAQIDVVVSPPSALGVERLRRLLELSAPALEREYLHRLPNGSSVVRVRTLLLTVHAEAARS